MKPRLDLVWHEGANELYFDRYGELEKFFDLKVYAFNRFQGRKFNEKRTNLHKYNGLFSNHWLTIISLKLIMDLIRSESRIIYLHQEPHSLIAFLVCLFCRDKKIFLDAAVINKRLNFNGFNFFERYVYRRATGFFYRNDDVKDVLVSRGMPIVKAVRRLGNGVSSNTFYCNQNKPTNFIIGYSGRVWRQKGIECLINLANQGYKVNFCGPVADEDLLEELLDSGCNYLGNLNKNELCDFYNNISLFILLSLPSPNWHEQFGRVVCGTPAIGSNTGFIPYLVGEKATFNAGDQDQIIKLVEEFSNSSKLNDLLDEQLNRIDAEFSWRAIASTVYSELNK